jgi:excisionase family DNA binding protein
MSEPDDRLLAPREVAALFRVEPRTVTRWADQGRLRSIRTLGGHRRFRESYILGLLHVDSFASGATSTTR